MNSTNNQKMSEYKTIEELKSIIIRPSQYKFKSKTEFKEWCKMGTKQDLQAALKEFEKDELYEYCAIMREVLNTHYQ